MIPGIVSAPLFASTQGLVATASPTRVVRLQGTHGSGSETLTTPATTVTVSGGTPPYSHSWSSGASTPGSPTSATTTFSATLSPDQEIDEQLIDTVTDANGVVTTAHCGVLLNLVNTT